MIEVIPDSEKTHWVNRTPESIRPYLQLSRLDRPVGYWLLTLPGWIGLAFAGLSHGLNWEDLKWALLILIGAIAMRGAGCTYNDIVDQDLDAQVVRTALRPLPAGTVTTKQAWIWLFLQCAIGLIILLCLPRLAQIVSLFSIPLVAAYPFMKRITWWPQLWLGLTFNWAVLVAYAIKTGTLSPAVSLLYIGLIFWTVGYDTIYACQDIEDDAFVGIKSTARHFGKYVKSGILFFYSLSLVFFFCALTTKDLNSLTGKYAIKYADEDITGINPIEPIWAIVVLILPAILLIWQVIRLDQSQKRRTLGLFKSNILVGFAFIVSLLLPIGFSALVMSILHSPH